MSFFFIRFNFLCRFPYRLRRSGPRVVLPTVEGDVQPVLRTVRVLRHGQLHAADQPQQWSV